MIYWARLAARIYGFKSKGRRRSEWELHKERREQRNKNRVPVERDRESRERD